MALRLRAAQIVRPVDEMIGPWRSKLTQLTVIEKMGRFTTAEDKALFELTQAIRRGRNELAEAVAAIPPELSKHEVVIRRTLALQELLNGADALRNRIRPLGTRA